MAGRVNDRGFSLEYVEDELLAHWKKAHTWKGIDPVKLADMRGFSASRIRSLMGEIERGHPKPKASNAGVCRSCGAEIVWIGKMMCDPPVLTVIDASGQVVRGREHHKKTCPHADKW